MAELNGKTYQAVYLTEEEKIVVDALRAGARIDIYFHDLTKEQVETHMSQLPDHVLPIRGERDLSDSSTQLINYWARNRDESIYLSFLVNEEKATDCQEA